MIKFNANTNVTAADNEVILCDLKYMLTDEEVLKVKSIIDGLVANRGGAGIASTSQTAYKAVSENVAPTATKAEKKPYVATKDFVPQYQIKELEGTDGTKLFCISRKNGWTRAEKSLMNGAIKALKGIKEIEVSGVKKDKDGNEKSITFKAWGYATESTAKKHLKELPAVFTVAQLNGEA